MTTTFIHTTVGTIESVTIDGSAPASSVNPRRLPSSPTGRLFLVATGRGCDVLAVAKEDETALKNFFPNLHHQPSLAELRVDPEWADDSLQTVLQVAAAGLTGQLDNELDDEFEVDDWIERRLDLHSDADSRFLVDA